MPFALPPDSSGSELGPPPAFDPELNAVLAPNAALFSASVTADMIDQMRAGSREMAVGVTDEDLRRGGAFTVETRSVPGPLGAPSVLLLTCQPTNVDKPTAALYFIHGGGMFSGDSRTGLLEVLDLAQSLGLAVVSVEYRLAPEHPHPAPVEDCYSGLSWLAQHADELKIDPARLVVVGGSAGGGLAAAVALLARDRGGPAVAGQLLMCPMLDDRNDSPSARQMAGLGVCVWDQTSNDTGWTALLGEARGGPDISPYAAPARAADLSALPPTFIDVGSAETFRDECVSYATRIWQAGGVAELHVWPGGFHGYTLLAPQAAISRQTLRSRLNWLRRLLAP